MAAVGDRQAGESAGLTSYVTMGEVRRRLGPER